MMYATTFLSATLITGVLATTALPDTANPSEILKGLALNYKEAGDHRESRASSACDASSQAFTGNCNLDCQCVDGRWQCCRLRKNINMMTKAEITRFTDAYVKVANDPRYSPAFASLSWSHAVLTCSFLLEKTGHVYSEKPNIYNTAVGYHNLLVLALENLLRLVDCGVTVPYWDVATMSSQQFENIVPPGFGGMGIGKNSCVEDGPFRNGAFKVPQFHYKGKTIPSSTCVTRNPFHTAPFAYQLFQTMLTVKPQSAVLLETIIFQSFDENFHLGIGGSFLGLTLAVDPLLFMLHNFGNKIIANYQLQGPEHLTGGGRWNKDVPITAFPWFKASDFMDYFNYPNDVCIRWAASMDRYVAMNMGYYAALEVPRNHHTSLPYKKLRLLDVGGRGGISFAAVLADLKLRFKSFKFEEDGPSIAKDWKKDKPEKGFLKPSGEAYPLCLKIIGIDPEFLHFNVTQQLAELIG